MQVAIILARGGSKGIPQKNIIDFCGKPLIAWTIEHCLQAKKIDKTFVSSDCDSILEISQKYGAEMIKRPDDLADDFSTSESGWIHAIQFIEHKFKNNIDLVIAPQVTSPLRTSKDLDHAIQKFESESYDSLFSASEIEDFFLWEYSQKNQLESINYDYINRKRRQDIQKQYVENGSFYLFKPTVLKKYHNRFGGNIGLSLMEFWKTFEIDSMEDLRMCRALMKEFLLK